MPPEEENNKNLENTNSSESEKSDDKEFTFT